MRKQVALYGPLTILLLLTLVLDTRAAFSRSQDFSSSAVRSPQFTTTTTTTRLYATGGWGIGPQRELTPEEFSKGGDRRAFEGYQLRDRGEFMRQVARDKQDLERGELDELLAVARQAGIQVKDPNERLNKFALENDDDDLDLSVPLEDDKQEDRQVSNSKMEDSITRMDEDTGALGVW